ncbi:hypothetical protein D3C85_1433770 [compost metagenome]
MKVAFGVQEVRGQQQQLVAAQRQASARVGHADDAIFRLADLGEMRHEALPHARDHEAGLGAAHPAVERGNDVGVGMRGNHIRQPGRREVAHHAHEQFVEGEVAAWVDDGAGVAVDDQELVGLHGLAIFLDQVAEHQAGMVPVAVQLNGHGMTIGKKADCRRWRARPS